jgi:High potential iron-sulfur protein
MTSSNRRVFLMQVAACGSVLAAAGAHAQAAKVDEKDPQAVALGYVADTTKADKKKFPKHAADQKCSNCALYQGKATDAAGGCPLFGTKQVAGAGWCSAWAKKA